MATINYYLDKPDKKGYSPIHLRINSEGKQVKVSTGEKVRPECFDKENQTVLSAAENHEAINHYLKFLKDRAEDLFKNSKKKRYTSHEIKEILHGHVRAYKQDATVSIIKQGASTGGKSFNFIDFFAGAGGFSEGFLQAQHQNRFFNFLLGSDINENCELTHVVRYNHQLGLDAEFLKQDITEPDFVDNLLRKLHGKEIDVVCGGPPCQSFSLAGKRKKYDKKDDLFANYLNIIKILRPKYFVMENVKGLLTKEGGKIKEMILSEIRSLIDVNELPKLVLFIKKISRRLDSHSAFTLEAIAKRLEFESKSEKELDDAKENYIQHIENKFRRLTPEIVDYKTSKTDQRISTIRHGLNLLSRGKEIAKIQKEIIREKDINYIDNDHFVESFNAFIEFLEPGSVIAHVQEAFDELNISKKYEHDYASIIQSLKIYVSSFDECISKLRAYCGQKEQEELDAILESIRLYRIKDAVVANASDYGVPQNRERVLFIGCRKDQQLIESIPATVSADDKVTVFEAIYDLDFIDNNEDLRNYEKVDMDVDFNGHAEKMRALIRKREISGDLSRKGLTYAEWSRKGRLNHRFSATKAFYVRNQEALNHGKKEFNALNNHRTSNQNEEVIRRLQIILEEGNYKEAQDRLENEGIASQKRNYNVLKPGGQSSTILTIPDDYIHYRSPRALTVREMARLQSFDDSFVFQGKRSTGGNHRKNEVPQYTLVGNAVPPLLARAVAIEILKNIT